MIGKFITLEGMDGAGKSTHIPHIIALLQAQGHEVVSTREPGGTDLGERLRELVLHETMHVETETLLMFAARKEHIECVIKPALARGAYVLSDRFTDASYAYQSGAKGLDANKIEALEQWVQGEFQPDLTLLFDVSVERLRVARSPDKFERENADFFSRIRIAYLQRASANPNRFRVIDANKPLGEVAKIVESIVLSL
jgi:dTMP kinase